MAGQKRRILPRLKMSDIKKALKTEAMPFASLSEADKGAYMEGLLSWQAPLYTHKKRPLWWYVVAGITTLGLTIYGLWSGAWTLSLAVVLFFGVYYYFQQQAIPVVEIIFSEIGVKVGNKVYPYSMFRTFWLDYTPPLTKELHLIPNNQYKYELTLDLQDQDPGQIKRFLQQFLPEWADRQKTITESLVHLIGL